MTRTKTRTATKSPLRQKSKKSIPLYLTEEERDGLREAGQFNGRVLDLVRAHIGPGVTTLQLDKLVYEFVKDHGHQPACLGYKGYPCTICTSINQVVCHGIPDKKPLEEGDIVNVDMTTIVNGWYGDSSETFLIGRVQPEAVRLTQVAFDAMHLGIEAAQPFGKLTDIGRAIERYVLSHGMSVVQEYQGHGIGREFHQEPGVPHYVPKMGASQEVLAPGMCFTIEPMVNLGTWRTFLDERDQWTVRTLDQSLSAQFEHTILMTESGPEVLTYPPNGPRSGHRFS